MKRALIAVLLALSACQGDPPDVPPSTPWEYICDQGDAGVPRHAVELMTGLSTDLTSSGYFDLGLVPSATANLCEVYDPAGEVVLEIYLADVGKTWQEAVFDKRLRAGGTPMPELLPGATGVYWAGPTAGFGPARGKANPLHEARAYLFRNGTELGIRLKHGAPGRDSVVNVLDLMRLIAPTLMPAGRG
ncbi:MAG: hypothetical protein HOV96_01720 [Nonomuraea sp.]|nr:hypothetical protein [Nonomuraea sp.]NUS05521.1 hypothetical protein [Nonomuraea sp.]